MKIFFTFLLLLFFTVAAQAQTPKTYTSSEILLQLKKLNVLGSVLYIAAHPDDENTRLLAYLANEKLYRTGYLSLTRGDGGQNLIGDEQGIDLGLIRTQELLAARRIDGAEQFFSRAYDFGFCKSPEEALDTWGHDKILSDVVWVIRKFKPDVIIARFPEDNRAGHGHHAASGILAREAFDAAADSARFPEQLKQGVTVWQAKRMLWNTFNFGGNSTQNESQFKVDVGMYNALLGKSYGEIAALSRSQHKSQGFGVPAQRGTVIEYFETIRGEKPVNDLMDGVDVSWLRMGDSPNVSASMIESAIQHFDQSGPSHSVKELVDLYRQVQENTIDDFWKQNKLNDIAKCIEACSGLFLEATANNQYAVQGDSLKVMVAANNRVGINASVSDINLFANSIKLDSLKKNTTVSKTVSVFIKQDDKLTQPYWLENPMDKGSFNVTNQQLIGKAENDPLSVEFNVYIEGEKFVFTKPLRYRFTDPVKGEIYQPVFITPTFTGKFLPEVDLEVNRTFGKEFLSVTSLKDNNSVKVYIKTSTGIVFGSACEFKLNKEESNLFPITFPDFIAMYDSLGREINTDYVYNEADHYCYEKGESLKEIRNIKYDHIPQIVYFKKIEPIKVVKGDIRCIGHSIGYIPGAGDKVPQALEQMGYKVTMLKQADINAANLKQFDAVITGIRAYNTNDWMSNVYDILMQYVNEGGVLLTQYNTNNFISSVKSKIGPYPFSISRNRVTDENAKVNFLLPGHPVLNYPNKITGKDFEGWVQERSTYHAEKTDSNYQRIISMKDSGEKEDDGSLIVANYGKGRFVYTGLVFFRELPAGVPGAYRLFANLIAPPRAPGKSSAGKKSTKKILPGKAH
ncbi:MAG: PIG-L family deacetylase [Chitinophagaceae bacterium]|nr:PIG-L family deacetylase [Chitinophagaceae bacterium]